MNRVDGEREEWRREVNGLFWIERLFLFLVFVFPTYVCGLIVLLILSTTLLALPFFLFFNPNLSSIGPSVSSYIYSLFFVSLVVAQLTCWSVWLGYWWILVISIGPHHVLLRPRVFQTVGWRLWAHLPLASHPFPLPCDPFHLHRWLLP